MRVPDADLARAGPHRPDHDIAMKPPSPTRTLAIPPSNVAQRKRTTIAAYHAAAAASFLHAASARSTASCSASTAARAASVSRRAPGRSRCRTAAASRLGCRCPGGPTPRHAPASPKHGRPPAPRRPSIPARRAERSRDLPAPAAAWSRRRVAPTRHRGPLRLPSARPLPTPGTATPAERSVSRAS